MSGRLLAHPLPLQRLNVAAAAATSCIFAYPTVVMRVIILTAGSAAVTFYDNIAGDTSGSKVGALPATTAVGDSFDLEIPCFNGLTATGGAGTPEYVIGHAPTKYN